ncbi:MAG: helix-turn-helix domain-containing protein [Treponema sp.]|jgi:cytoskeletal protein RodZ|nr:helix-turn-helix domain-containing protein [Treponema sp.]
MDSLGERLRRAREEKGRSLDQASRDTLIASRYLQALEGEDFSGFPGEPYVLGFLRNYSEYLGLDVQEQLSLYRALKIQEQPIPMDQLLRSPPPVKKIVLGILIPLLVLAAAGGGFYIYTHRPVKESVAAELRQPVEYSIGAEPLERRFYTGDSVLVSLGLNPYKLVFSSLGEALALTTPLGQLTLDLGQEANLDLDEDGLTELRVTAADFAKNNAGAGALLRFELLQIAAPPVESPGPPASPSSETVIFSSPNAYPFTVQLNFQGYCMFRWEILYERDRPERNERYFQRGEELNIQAQNGVRIGASNAQAVKLQITGGGRTVPVELGGAGEVVVANIRWDREGENRRVILERLE